MKLTTKSEYALLALIYIARHQKDGYIKAERICEEYRLSKKYLEQLIFLLKQNGLIKAKKGAGGGYCLALSANKISIARIIRLMDGRLSPVESVSKYFFAKTPLVQEKRAISLFREVRKCMVNKLEKTMVSDLV